MITSSRSSLTCRAAFCWAAMCCCSALSRNSLRLARGTGRLLDGGGEGGGTIKVNWVFTGTSPYLTWLQTGSGAVSSPSPTRPRLPPEPCLGKLKQKPQTHQCMNINKNKTNTNWRRQSWVKAGERNVKEHQRSNCKIKINAIFPSKRQKYLVLED